MLVTVETEVDERSAFAQQRALTSFAESGLPEPEEMIVRKDSLIFLWLEPSVAVIIDLED